MNRYKKPYRVLLTYPRQRTEYKTGEGVDGEKNIAVNATNILTQYESLIGRVTTKPKTYHGEFGTCARLTMEQENDTSFVINREVTMIVGRGRRVRGNHRPLRRRRDARVRTPRLNPITRNGLTSEHDERRPSHNRQRSLSRPNPLVQRSPSDHAWQSHTRAPVHTSRLH